MYRSRRRWDRSRPEIEVGKAVVANYAMTLQSMHWDLAPRAEFHLFRIVDAGLIGSGHSAERSGSAASNAR
jgi:hypothetical protein